MTPDEFLQEYPIGTRPSIVRYWQKTWKPVDVQRLVIGVNQIHLLDGLETEMQEWLEEYAGEENKDWRWYKLNVEFVNAEPAMHFRLRFGEWLQ